MDVETPQINSGDVNPQPVHQLKMIQYKFNPINCLAKNDSNSLLAVARYSSDIKSMYNSPPQVSDVEIWDPQTMFHLRVCLDFLCNFLTYFI
jgi:hypothetical protein